MSEYKYHHDEDEGSWGRSKPKIGYKKPIKPIQPIESPDDWVIIQTSEGSLKTKRCAHVEYGDRCHNPGTMSHPGGDKSQWFCKTHFHQY